MTGALLAAACGTTQGTATESGELPPITTDTTVALAAPGTDTTSPVRPVSDVVADMARAVNPTGPADPWLQFANPEIFTPTSIDLESLNRLSDALVLVTGMKVERWWEAPTSNANVPDAPKVKPTAYLRLRADIEIVSGSLPLRNDDTTIFIDLVALDGQPPADTTLTLPPTPFLAYVTSTSYFEQQWDQFEQAWGVEATKAFRALRDQGYVPTTRAGVLVTHQDRLRPALLEADLAIGNPEEFTAWFPDRGHDNLTVEGHNHPTEVDTASSLSPFPAILNELETTDIATVVDTAAAHRRPPATEIKQAVLDYQTTAVPQS